MLVGRSIKRETNEIDGFFRQARRTAAAVLKYGKDGQRSMAEKDAIPCLCFGGTDYQAAMVPCGEPHKPLPTTQCAQAQPGRCQSYLLTSPKCARAVNAIEI